MFILSNLNFEIFCTFVYLHNVLAMIVKVLFVLAEVRFILFISQLITEYIPLGAINKH